MDNCTEARRCVRAEECSDINEIEQKLTPFGLCLQRAYALQPSGDRVTRHPGDKHNIPAHARRGLMPLIRTLNLLDHNALQPLRMALRRIYTWRFKLVQLAKSARCAPRATSWCRDTWRTIVIKATGTRPHSVSMRRMATWSSLRRRQIDRNSFWRAL